MCGIAGIWHSTGSRPPEQTLANMLDRLRHRGPDDCGSWTGDQGALALGQRRLSIIDLSSAGHQPMHSASGRYTITFNGEIYNFRGLRAELEQLGYPFRGGSDSEVLLACFEHWPADEVLPRLHGMFALALWDRDHRTLLLARDRMGEKPLYYGWHGNQFHFASELTAILPALPAGNSVDRTALRAYLDRGYVPAPRSIYHGIHKLPPGASLLLKDTGAPAGFDPERSPRRYWQPVVTQSEATLGPTESVDLLERALATAIDQELVADVPLGAFLSGGIDSSLVVAMMQSRSTQPVRTFTVAFDTPGFNEAAFAREIACHLGCDHTEIPLRSRDVLDLAPGFGARLDEPHANPSQVPVFLMCRAARESVTVALSGDAGDELFCGYNRYLQGVRSWSTAQSIPRPLRRAAGFALGAVPGAWIDAVLGHRGQNLGVRVGKLAKVLAASNWSEVYNQLLNNPDHGLVAGEQAIPYPMATGVIDPLDAAMLLDQQTYLPDDNLAKVDRMSMASSLEVRAPLLHPEVLTASAAIPAQIKALGGQSKWPLRELLSRYIPRPLFERPKMGFTVPVAQWLRSDLNSWGHDLVTSGSAILDAAELRRIWAQFNRGHWQYGNLLWAALQFIEWERVRNETNAGGYSERSSP